MARVQVPGSVHQAVERAVGAAGGPSAVAAAMGLAHAGTVSRWSSDDEDAGRPMRLVEADRLARLSPPAAAVLAGHFAAVAGGVFDPVAAAVSPHQALADLARAAAEVQARFLEARDPGSPGGSAITRAECAAILAQIDRAMAPLTAIRTLVREVAE